MHSALSHEAQKAILDDRLRRASRLATAPVPHRRGPRTRRAVVAVVLALVTWMLIGTPSALAAGKTLYVSSSASADPACGLASQSNPFATVALLHGRILQLRQIDEGESVGYGATFHAARPTVLAVAGLGYTDGLMRVLAGRGLGAIGGVRVPIAGRVSMDLITLDVTDVPEGKRRVGDLIEFFGDTITLDEIAAAAGTAPYEILTAMSRRVPHAYEDGA